MNGRAHGLRPQGLPRGSPFPFRRRGLGAVLRRLAWLASAALPPAAAAAPTDAGALPAGRLRILLHGSDGSRTDIGHVDLQPGTDGGAQFVLSLDGSRFTDHFLSMREFKCLDVPGGGGAILCHVPYPYENPRRVSAGDRAWLEHALLFMSKRPGEFGARLWNGIYWELSPDGRGWVGRAQAVDLNRIAAPPERPGPPLRRALRDDLPPGAAGFVRLTIEP